MRIVLEPTKAEIGKQRGTDRLIEPRRETMIVNNRAPTEPANASSYATQPDPQVGTPVKAVVRTCVPAKDMQVPRCLIIAARIEGVSMERTGARAEKVIGEITINWLGEQLQHRHCCWRKPTDRNQISCKGSASGPGVRIPCGGIIDLSVAIGNMPQVIA